MWPNPLKTANLITFTEESHFLSSGPKVALSALSCYVWKIRIKIFPVLCFLLFELNRNIYRLSCIYSVRIREKQNRKEDLFRQCRKRKFTITTLFPNLCIDVGKQYIYIVVTTENFTIAIIFFSNISLFK